MATTEITTTLDRAGWELGTVHGRAAANHRVVRDLRADWRRWSAGERTAALAMVAVWVAAILAFVAISGA